MAENKPFDNLLSECDAISENCAYTAQAHYAKAQSLGRIKAWLFGSSALLSAAGGAFPTLDWGKWWGLLAVAGGLLAGIGALLGLDEVGKQHEYAGNLLTALRHEARALAQGVYLELPRPEFVAEVRRLHDRYSNYTQALPITDENSFEQGRRKIKKGDLQPDKNLDAGK